MTDRCIRFLTTAANPPPSAVGTTLVVLDTTWTAGVAERSDLVPLLRLVSRTVARFDTFRESLDRLDRWSEAAGIPEAMTVDGVCWWYHIRPRLADSLNLLLLWVHIVAGVEQELEQARERPDRSSESPRDVLALHVPAAERSLVAVARAWAAANPQQRTVLVEESADTGTVPVPRAVPGTGTFPARLLRRWRAQRRKGEHLRRRRLLDARFAHLAALPRRVLVVAQPRIYQALVTADGPRIADPQLAPTVARFAAHGLTPIVVGLELDHADDRQWEHAQADAALLPQSLIDARWSDPSDRVLPSAEVPSALARAAGVPLDVDGVDLASPLLSELTTLAGSWLEGQRRQAMRIGRLIAELRPEAMFLNHEGIRTAWLAAARRAGVPVFAVQHGLIYPHHTVYRHARAPGLIFPTCTFTFGPYEREVLLQHGSYRPDEVVVSGSPRLDLDVVVTDPAARDRERQALRAELGVAPGLRMLVVSTAHTELFRRFLLPNLIDRLLGGPLPGVHVVFKQHPGETDEGPYRRLVANLAQARGYAEPPMSVVRQIDLNRLLRAADAHLGLHSTVLTDAVVVGTPNLIAMTQAFADLLNYVEAGVAVPVATADDLRQAMDDPPRMDPAARAAFLRAHFAPGPAADRIAAGIAEAIGAPAAAP